MTARNYCPAGDKCDHLTKAAKAAEHGTPEEFAAWVRKTQAEGDITADDAVDTIERYRKEYEASPE
jgi:hypothetical protein